MATACQVAFTFSLTLSDRPAYGPITVSVKAVIGARLELMNWYASFYQALELCTLFTLAARKLIIKLYTVLLLPPSVWIFLNIDTFPYNLLFFLDIMLMDFGLDVLVLSLETCQDYFWK